MKLTHEDKLSIAIWFGILGVVLLTLWAVQFRETYKVPPEPVKPLEQGEIQATKSVKSITGTASWYRYSIGDWTNENALTCASRDFPRYSWVRISYNGMSVECKITDFIEHPDRVIDVSPRIFKLFKPLSAGLIDGVKVEGI